jgi:hypothetical protein
VARTLHRRAPIGQGLDRDLGAVVVERADGHLDASRGREKGFGDRDRLVTQAAVAADDPKGPTADRQPHVARAAGVHDAPALDLSRRDLVLGLAAAIDREHASFAPTMPIDERRLRDVAVAIELTSSRTRRRSASKTGSSEPRTTIAP